MKYKKPIGKKQRTKEKVELEELSPRHWAHKCLLQVLLLQDLLCTGYCDSDGITVGFLFYAAKDEERIKTIQKQDALFTLGISNELFEFIRSRTDDELEYLTRAAKLSELEAQKDRIDIEISEIKNSLK